MTIEHCEAIRPEQRTTDGETRQNLNKQPPVVLSTKTYSWPTEDWYTNKNKQQNNDKQT